MYSYVGLHVLNSYQLKSNQACKWAVQNFVEILLEIIIYLEIFSHLEIWKLRDAS